ncbi:non-specific serine/threonine protein kinase [Ranunculus cassubicifolius]
MDILPLILRLCLLMLVCTVLISGLGNDTDTQTLLAFKNEITRDPHQVMSSWNHSTHFCTWFGVTCSLRHQRVVTLDLGNHELVGTISPSVGNLSFLKVLNLSSNNYHGEIPQEVGRLSRLHHLDLSVNSLGGKIPLNLSKCENLTYLNVGYNALVGSIPFHLASLKNLVRLGLFNNNLTGTIPPWVGNYSSLTDLSVVSNSLHGSIPNELGQLSKLQHFQVGDNMLSGVIPSPLYNITSLSHFLVAKNQLHGSLPSNLGLTLPNLLYFYVDLNNFHGPIPNSLSNASNIQSLDFSSNDFTGSVPNLGSLQSLFRLNFEGNKLGYGGENDLSFITSLSNCTVLEVLSLDDNSLGGNLPESIGNLSTHLQFLSLGRNLFNGPLPTSIENLINLTVLSVENNSFSGSILFEMGKLQQLNQLLLNYNNFSGQIPSSLGNLTRLLYLHMNHNRLEGTIPPSLGNCKEMSELDISSNTLSGTIPKEVLTLSSLMHFSVATNSLSGSLPLEVGTLINLEELDVSDNNLSGTIPATLGSCVKLELLSMGGNLFYGPVPPSLEFLGGVQMINFSHNNLSGKIPEFLMNVSLLEYLDLSYNDFDGNVPKEGIFKNTSAISVLGNKKICGGIKELHLRVCNEDKVKRSGQPHSIRVIIIIAFGVLSFIVAAMSFIVAAICCSASCLRNFRKPNAAGNATANSSALDQWRLGASYLEIFNSTNGFSSECLIGSGSFGSVYKGVLSDQETFVAIKVLNLQQKGAANSFLAECEALKNIRHRNLIKVVTVCSSIDFKGNDFKALVYEFMPNHSLERWLHPNTGDRLSSRNLSFIQRLDIAIDVAFGLEYLHHNYEETIVHCDIKPSNILLDRDMTARVGDFGLARFLFNNSGDQSQSQTLSSGLKGSIGYIPPEYGVGGQVSTHGDMYSYGILLLEMFTGKMPTNEMFKDGLNLLDFVSMALPDRVSEIVDASLFSETDGIEKDGEIGEPGNIKESEEAPALSRRTTQWKRLDCLVSVLTIALSCCAPLPKDRTVVTDVVKKMIDVRHLFCRAP